MMRTVFLLMGVAAPLMAGCSTTVRVASEPEACELAKASFTDSLARSRIAFCDHVIPEANPPGYYVMAIHSDRKCDGICSTNMGSLAIRKSTGEVFEWNVADMALGPPVGSRP